jgi:hypothetical protein
MPVTKCSNGKYKIGNGGCVFETEEKAMQVWKAILAGGNYAAGVPHYLADGTLYTGATHKDASGKLMTGAVHTEDSQYLYHKEDL